MPPDCPTRGNGCCNCGYPHLSLCVWWAVSWRMRVVEKVIPWRNAKNLSWMSCGFVIDGKIFDFPGMIRTFVQEEIDVIIDHHHILSSIHIFDFPEQSDPPSANLKYKYLHFHYMLMTVAYTSAMNIGFSSIDCERVVFQNRGRT